MRRAIHRLASAKQRVQTCAVPSSTRGSAPLTCLSKLDHRNGCFNLWPDAGLDPLQPIDELFDAWSLVQLPAPYLAVPHVPAHRRSSRSRRAGCTLYPASSSGFSTVQQRCRLPDHVVDAAAGAARLWCTMPDLHPRRYGPSRRNTHWLPFWLCFICGSAVRLRRSWSNLPLARRSRWRPPPCCRQQQAPALQVTVDHRQICGASLCLPAGGGSEVNRGLSSGSRVCPAFRPANSRNSAMSAQRHPSPGRSA
jgi:hypothetical protein